VVRPRPLEWRYARVSSMPYFFGTFDVFPNDKLPMTRQLRLPKQPIWNRWETPGANAADYKSGDAIVKQVPRPAQRVGNK
jgi:hypothetical protein